MTCQETAFVMALSAMHSARAAADNAHDLYRDDETMRFNGLYWEASQIVADLNFRADIAA